MIDRSLLRRLRVTAFGILGAIVGIEFLRAAVALYVHRHEPTVPATLSVIISLIVLVIVAILVTRVLLPAQRAVLENMRGAEVARESLERSEAWYRSIFDRHPNPAVAIDRDGSYLRVNAAMEQLSGYRESELLGQEVRMTADEHLPAVRAALRAAEEGKPSQFEIELVRKDGARRTISVDAVPMGSGGVVAGMYAFSRDVTESRHAMRREALQRERFRVVALLAARESSSADRISETLEFATQTLEMDACHVGIVHESTLVVTAGSGSPYPQGAEIPLARSFSRHVLGSHEVLVIKDVAREPWASDPAHAWQPWAAYVCISISAGGDRVGALTFVKNRPLERFDDADRDFVVVIASLIGAHLQREREERELARLAFVDALTGLPNRAYFSEQIDLAIAQARRDDTSFALQYVDLDGFKTVNDLQGHDAGDHVLAVVAARLKMAARLSDVVARYGGDEFVVLQRRYEGDDGAAHLAQRLINAAAEPIIIRDEIVRLGASVGIACFPRDAQTAEELLRCADAAMYRAKNGGRNRLELYG